MVEGYKCSISHDNGLAVAVALKHDYTPGGAVVDLCRRTQVSTTPHSHVTTSKVIMLCLVTNIALITLSAGWLFLSMDYSVIFLFIVSLFMSVGLFLDGASIILKVWCRKHHPEK